MNTKTLAIAGLILAASAGRADAGAEISDWMRVYDPSGTIFKEVIVTEEDELRNGPDFVYYMGLDLTMVDETEFGHFTILTEGVGGPGSDIFGIATGGPTGALDLAFASDIDGVMFPFGDSGPITLPETGLVFDATRYLSAPFRDTGWTAAFWSGGEAAPVPEPASIAMWGLGAIGMMLAVRKRRQA